MGTNENVLKNEELELIKNAENIEEIEKVECIDNSEVQTILDEEVIVENVKREEEIDSEEVAEEEEETTEAEEEQTEVEEENEIAKEQKIDMQKTQRIEILGELLKEAEKTQPQKIEESNEVEEDEVQKIELEQDAHEEQIENPQENITEIEENGNKEEKKAKNTHAQDKKDDRLERLLFERINTMQGKIKESLELIKKFERINAKEENLPNIVTTLHDKLTQEVIKQFRTVGIEFNMKSYLVQSIVSDLLGKFEEGITEFKECSENLNFVREVQEDFESRVELAPTSKVKNIFARLRGIFKPERKQECIERLERERQEKKLEEANIHLIKYKFKNSELEKYTIRKNIVESLTHEILYGKSSGLNLSTEEFINEKISEEMHKLGLQYLLDPLKEEIFKSYTEKNPNVSKEDLLQMHVGDVKKSMKTNTYDIARSRISMVTNMNNEQEDRMVV